MEKQQEHQLQIIWENIPSPVSIPAKTRKRLAGLLGELLSAYWQGYKENSNNLPKGEEHEKQNNR